MSKFVIALGGNIGDVEERFAELQRTMTADGFKIYSAAPVFRNPAAGCPPGTPDFCNSAILAEKDILPLELLDYLQSLEVRFGRAADHLPNRSRTLDLDIIWFENVRMNTPRLTIPHPRAKERDFVLIPLRSIAPGLEKEL